MAIIKPLEVTEQKLLLENHQIDNALVKKFINRLSSHIGTYDYDLANKRGFSYDVGKGEMKVVIMSNKEETLRVVYGQVNGEETLFGGVVAEEKGKKILRTYNLEEDVIVKIAETEVTDEFLAKAKEQRVEFGAKTPDKKEDVIKQLNLPCLHGKYCGLKCSGPGKPETPVDACCQKHDNCYGERGYFSCACDLIIIGCLTPYVAAGSEWAILISNYFKGSICNPFI